MGKDNTMRPVLKLFDDMAPIEKLDHIERCLAKAYPEVTAVTELADVLDVWDYWAPYLISRLRELESLNNPIKSPIVSMCDL